MIGIAMAGIKAAEVVMSLRGRKATALSPISPKSNPGRWASMPLFSEVPVSPAEGFAEGLAVIDAMINWIGFDLNGARWNPNKLLIIL